MTTPQLNAPLLGQPGSRASLQTPALIIDLDALERNIAAMAQHARKHGVQLRPHAKTHKSAEIARRQLAAGAVGICVAKLGEAEALRRAGIESLLVTCPVVSKAGIRRLIALNETTEDLMAVCDNANLARQLAGAAQASGKPLRLLVELDPKVGRTGVPIGEAGFALVDTVAAQAALRFAGLQCYAGNLQQLEPPAARRERSLAILRELGEFCDTLKRRGIPAGIVSGGGTGTFDMDPEARVLTELQPGSYVFMDREYSGLWTGQAQRPPFEIALFVQTTVISVDHGDSVSTDAGFKAFATDAGPPTIASGAPEGATYAFAGDEHGQISCPNAGQKFLPGDVVTCVAPHCDPTVNLYDWYHVVRGDVLEAIWPVDARGCSA